MNILVCVKQVPDPEEIRADPETNTIVREGVPSVINPCDIYALEAAARIKDRDPSTRIVALSMGPEQAKTALRESMAIAADKAYLVSGRAFGGADTLATSYTLSCAIQAIEKEEGPFDAIFCGKQAADSDTAQVGPELAEHLDYPQVTCALEAEQDGSSLKLRRETESGVQLIAAEMPCVVTFAKPDFAPRYPDLRRLRAAYRTELTVLTPEDLSVDPTRIGKSGSPTQVKGSFVPQRSAGGIRIREATDPASAAKLAEMLAEAGVV